jgi:dTDP-4-dehydrorhamnose reductase
VKIIVTGDKGFLGSRLIKRLEEKHKAIGLNRSVGDLSHYKTVHDFISKHSPEVVIHCAAIGDIGKCENNKDLAYKSNYIATKNIASACADNNSRLVYISSDQVYNASTLDQITEMTAIDPTNYYGFLKAEAEKDVQSIVPKSHIARIGWQFDWYKPHVDDSRGGLMRLVSRALSANTPLYCDPNSHQYICYVQDTIDALIKMAEQAVPYGIYNVTQETEKTIFESFAFAMSSIGADEETVKRLVLPRDAEKPHNLWAKPYNLEMCGHKMPSFEEGIARCIRENKQS